MRAKPLVMPAFCGCKWACESRRERFRPIPPTVNLTGAATPAKGSHVRRIVGDSDENVDGGDRLSTRELLMSRGKNSYRSS
jgi:hypothetical protein